MLIWITLALLVFAISWATNFWLSRNADQLQLIESPNYRSSHHHPTPKGGGLGILLASSLVGIGVSVYSEWQTIWTVILVLSVLIAITGLWDDLNPLSARIRFSVQLIICLTLLVVIGEIPPVTLFYGFILHDWWLKGLLLFFGIWWLNLFNFMDGIDGLAAVQSIYMLLVASSLFMLTSSDIQVNLVYIWMGGLAAATLGFLFHNWPPAKIFMGDVGSMYLAFLIFALGLYSTQHYSQPVSTGFAVWLILAAVFISDTTITLIARILTNQPWHKAHRSHAYQRLSRHLGNHRAVTIIIIVVNIFWLTPLAWMCVMWPQWAGKILLLAYIPLIFTIWKLGAGRPGDI